MTIEPPRRLEELLRTRGATLDDITFAFFHTVKMPRSKGANVEIQFTEVLTKLQKPGSSGPNQEIESFHWVFEKAKEEGWEDELDVYLLNRHLPILASMIRDRRDNELPFSRQFSFNLYIRSLIGKSNEIMRLLSSFLEESDISPPAIILEIIELDPIKDEKHLEGLKPIKQKLDRFGYCFAWDDINSTSVDMIQRLIDSYSVQYIKLSHPGGSADAHFFDNLLLGLELKINKELLVIEHIDDATKLRKYFNRGFILFGGRYLHPESPTSFDLPHHKIPELLSIVTDSLDTNLSVANPPTIQKRSLKRGWSSLLPHRLIGKLAIGVVLTAILLFSFITLGYPAVRVWFAQRHMAQDLITWVNDVPPPSYYSYPKEDIGHSDLAPSIPSQSLPKTPVNVQEAEACRAKALDAWDHHLKAGRKDEEHQRRAITWMREALAIDPTNPNNYFDLQAFLAEEDTLRNGREIIELLEKGLSLREDYEKRRSLADTYEKMGQYMEAIDQRRILLKKYDRDQVDNFIALARLFDRIQDYARLKKTCKEALSLSMSSDQESKIRHYLNRAYWNLGEHQAGYNNSCRMLDIYPNDPQAMMDRKLFLTKINEGRIQRRSGPTVLIMK